MQIWQNIIQCSLKRIRSSDHTSLTIYHVYLTQSTSFGARFSLQLLSPALRNLSLLQFYYNLFFWQVHFKLVLVNKPPPPLWILHHLLTAQVVNALLPLHRAEALLTNATIQRVMGVAPVMAAPCQSSRLVPLGRRPLQA